jgi:hypothetical protein
LLNKTERFCGKPRVFDQVAGETNELRGQFIDGADHRGGVIHVAFVMEISEMDEAAIASAAQIEVRHLQCCRFDETGIDADRRGQSERRQAEKFSACDLRHPSRPSRSI